ncbi:DUF3179 domain-containing protein [bacterium]|nr:DUF3179 domain-containing protein [bacterium]
MLVITRTKGVLVLLVLGLSSCLSEDASNGPSNGSLNDDSEWNIPVGEIIGGGVSKDAIPSLFNPRMISASEANYLRDRDLVVGIVVNGQARAYPHTILDWHEVVNEDLPGQRLTVTLCPLTGTGIVFDGMNGDRELTFGVSGLLYNNNLIMFDRQTDSHWPQMRLQSDEGVLRNTKQRIYPSIETSWGTWKKLHPNTIIMSTNTGFSRPYSQPGSAYPGYTALNSQPLFRNAVSFRDDRLPPKQRVHGVITSSAGGDPSDYPTKVYVITPGADAQVINDAIAGTPIVVINDGSNNFAVSYSSDVNGQSLTFRRIDQAEPFPFLLIDEETGSNWNVLGEAVSGPLTGKKLQKTLSYNAYWFAWGTFFVGADIFE